MRLYLSRKQFIRLLTSTIVFFSICVAPFSLGAMAADVPYLSTPEQRETEKQALRQEYAQLIAEQSNLKKAYLLATTRAEKTALTNKINSLNLRIQLYENRLQVLQQAEENKNGSTALSTPSTGK